MKFPILILVFWLQGGVGSLAHAQIIPEELLSNPDAHELPDSSQGHLFGSWGGGRTKLLKRGVKLDLHSISDFLWNIESAQKERTASWNRVRGTIDIDFGKLVHIQSFSLHVTGVWQAGGNLGAYLGLIANPSSLVSKNAFRLDSWWFEKHWLGDHLATRVGQFAGQDSYGQQNFGKSFVSEPLGANPDNLSETFESYDPAATPAFEVRAVPLHHFYVKSMVLAEDRRPFVDNPTGLVPQFHGTPVSVSEIGFTPGKDALSAAPADNAASRKGYSGLYQFGAAYDPGKFVTPVSTSPRSGNYLLYWIVSQAIWRVDPHEAKGIDATFAYDWSPAAINAHNQTFSAGLRYNEPLPLKFHNTMELGYVQTSVSPEFQVAGSATVKTERAFEFNSLLHVFPMMYVQPTIQYYANAGGTGRRDVIFGFRTKVEF